MIGDIPVVMLSSAICSVHTIVVLLTAPVELIVIICCCRLKTDRQDEVLPTEN